MGQEQQITQKNLQITQKNQQITQQSGWDRKREEDGQKNDQKCLKSRRDLILGKKERPTPKT